MTLVKAFLGGLVSGILEMGSYWRSMAAGWAMGSILIFPSLFYAISGSSRTLLITVLMINVVLSVAASLWNSKYLVTDSEDVFVVRTLLLTCLSTLGVLLWLKHFVWI